MIEELMLIVLSIAALSKQGSCMGPLGAPGMSQMGDLDEEAIYPCFHDMNCELGDDIFEEIQSCYFMVEENVFDKCLAWIAEMGHEMNTKVHKEIMQHMCAQSEDSKRETFDHVAKNFMDDLSKTCYKGAGKECETQKKALYCVAGLITKYNEEGKCGPEK